ncbi:phosphotransferase family protein, partial [Psychrobacter urativorans]|uniref:phosphotransferase family protein n=1 Tax=Psychrobacter urativorans TaxID=45610 RepID=UPI003BB4FF3B
MSDNNNNLQSSRSNNSGNGNNSSDNLATDSHTNQKSNSTDKSLTHTVLDKGGEVREGEELDAQAVTIWLREQGVEVVGEPVVTQFSGGASNWTYRLQYANQDLILRRPPKGTKAKSAHDMVREYTVQEALKDAYPYVPKMVA